MTRALRRFADSSRRDSLADRLRRRRWQLFLGLIDDLPRPVRVLDVGGTQNFWDQMDPRDELGVDLVLLNIVPQTVDRARTHAVVGDAADLSAFGDGEFDAVLSNSVIEHLPAPELQARMAAEVQRVGKRYAVQTPNRYFPIEPHFLFPFFQFLPVAMRTFLLRRFRLGWYARQADPAAAREIATSIRLVTHGELQRWFPGATIVRERVFLLTKSFVVLGADAHPSGDQPPR